MEFDESLSTVHAYLCADGYVIKNPDTQKQKYYYIGFRNTNLVLLKDFQKRFREYFGIVPRLIEGKRCVVQNKELYEKLIRKFGSFYSRDWKMPSLDNKLDRKWLRAFFDCEGWVFCKHHQNRHIGLDSINEEGIDQVVNALNRIGIKTIKKTIKKRGIFRIFIFGKDNLKRFEKEVGFLHPDKKEKLAKAIRDYMDYIWRFPKDNCKEIVLGILKEKARIKKPYPVRVVSKEESNLLMLKEKLSNFFLIHSLVHKRINGIGTIYYELSINRKEDIKKLINLKVIPNIFKERPIG